MRLTIEDNPQSIKRYGHVRPARGRAAPCARPCPGSTRTCSREKGHHGPHVALGVFNRVLAVWDGGGTAPSKSPAPRLGPGARRPVAGGTRRSSVGLLDGLRSLLQSSPEEVAWRVFFIAFAAFAVGGFMLILMG